MSSGYPNRVIKIPFPDLSADPEKDPVWVVIRNPKLLPPKMLRPGKEAQAAAEAVKAARDAGEEPSAGDEETAQNGTYAMAGRLVIAWRVYDPLAVPEIDPLTGEEVEGSGQVLLPLPAGGAGATVEQFAALPMQIQVAVFNAITEAANPPQAQEGEPTPKTSSSSPSPSTTEPGAAAPSPQN